MDLTDINIIHQLLDKYALTPTKSKGQNFLIDRGALAEVMAAAELTPDDAVLEIGPGLGVLTRELAATAKTVLSVEVDAPAVRALRHTLADLANVEVLQADILKLKNQEISDRLGGPYQLVANLPYNITGRVLRKFLSYPPRPTSVTLMVQKEVAERLTALPGKMSILAVAAQVYGTVELVAVVSRQSFYPAPEVDSAIVHLAGFGQDRLNLKGVDEQRFWQLVKIGFSSRRKQLQNNLSAGLKMTKDAVKEHLIAAGLDPQIRAQDLSIDDWLRLAKKF
ncbi:ribosomal RNA small subunit methyltransferase A [Candidatus Falkowbacteria bacterium]|nr:ribosomal RNA small subunit methyltransferase A [Candidatus Falkowbacteria bacterium]